MASLKPGGRFVATDVYEAGGVALVARELLKRELVHAGAERRWALARRDRSRRRGEPGPGSRRPAGDAAQADRRARGSLRQPRAGGLRRQARRARAASPPRAGARLRLGGSVLRRGEGPNIAEGDVVVIRYEGPAAGRHARDAARDRGARRRGLGDSVALVTDGRFSGATRRAHGRRRLARGRARRSPGGAARRGHRGRRRRGARAAGRALGRRAGSTARRLGAAGAALHAWGLRQVRGAGLFRVEGAVTTAPL